MASKKRVHVCNGEDEEQEDEKMEQFFALIRNFHEAVNRRKNELRQRDEKIRRVDGMQTSWVPTFEWADFADEIEFRRPSTINNKEEKGKHEEEEEGLDLRLTL
ncbi:hypothetical protein Gogos_009819 [Gossypium gossypioides]|uniref:Uncharacterized protein n=1 Tax=Gossypium gossypioides TaxID=34282 RepID=A0A7J9BJ83_GOSGO|nr:hypothetical protein [Gossypium gossypioides]